MNRRDFFKYCGSLLALTLLTKKETLAAFLPNHNEILCAEKFRFAQNHSLASKPLNEVLLSIARTFIGTPYKSHPLEKGEEEHLVVDLEGVDCVTLYEYALVFARCIKKQRTTYEDFRAELQFVRYRKGQIAGYASRLHYTSDYFYDNEKKGVLKNITQKIGGTPFRKQINFMTTHRDLYPQLNDERTYKELKTIEEEISNRTLYHIPKKSVYASVPHIQNGDILGITTTREGLDCKHTGIAIWHKKKVHMLHAPLPGTTVQITQQPLAEYLLRSKEAAGIIVARPLEV